MIEILCTLGPTSMNDRVIRRLEKLGVSLFRINLSHTDLGGLERTIRFIQERSAVPVCLDTEGAQVRTGKLADGKIQVSQNTVIRAYARFVPEDPYSFCLYPYNIIDDLEIGDFLTIDFQNVLAQVSAKGADCVKMRVLSAGVIGQNKAVTVHRPLSLPPLTEKDKEAIRIGKALGVRHVALSFAHRGSDVEQIRKEAGEKAFVISKIECMSALRNLEEIIDNSDAILIDRGDLSRELPIERIPTAQWHITERAKGKGKKVYVATNLLESMISSPSPTRAEVNDVFMAIRENVGGLVLAAETAIGKYPIECTSMIRKLIHEYSNGTSFNDLESAKDFASILLPEPHGGRLIQQMLPASEISNAEKLPSLTVGDDVLIDCEQIALGTYSPLEGFMTRSDLDSVLDRYALADGTIWTLPMTLAVRKKDAAKLAAGMAIALRTETGVLHSTMEITDIYSIDPAKVCFSWFGTDSMRHPGVSKLKSSDGYFLGGRIRLVRPMQGPLRQYVMTPSQLRFVFEKKGWSRIVGFHTRNVPHRIHEHIQLMAMDIAHADGLLISPVLGSKKSGDFLPEPIMKSYEALIRFGAYPADKVFLSGFYTYSRYAGPREAVFTALCRKNMGCSHFIVGRDHTGVGDFYDQDASRRIFEQMGDIGIEPIFFEAMGYDEENGQFASLKKVPSARQVSGTQVRESILGNRSLPEWMLKPIVQEVLKSELSAGRAIFQG